MGDSKKATGKLIDALRRANPEADKKQIGKEVQPLRDIAERTAGKPPTKSN